MRGLVKVDVFVVEERLAGVTPNRAIAFRNLGVDHGLGLQVLPDPKAIAPSKGGKQ
jgi:hypothetical protein